MSKEQDGGPAFPQDLQGRRGDDPSLQGMSLRDWFAGQAVSGVLLMVSTKHLAAQMAGDKEAVEKLNKVFVDSAIADEAYTLADAMLEAREK